MKAKADLYGVFDDSELTEFFVKKLSVTDIALSIEAFIRNNYDGRISFLPCEYENRFILFGDFELASILKSVIKELTLARTCCIFFEHKDGDFIIAFRAHESTPPSEHAIVQIAAEAQRVGLSVAFEGNTLRLIVPTHKFATLPIYNRNKLRFYGVLHAAFSD